MRKNRNDPARGFSLAELMVVVIIMALIGAMVIPMAVDTGSEQARSAAQMVMADLEYAQNYAITTQMEVSVQFNVTQNSYVLSYTDPISNASVVLKHPITQNEYRVNFSAAKGFERTALSAPSFGEASQVVFSALGAPNPDGSVTVSAGSHAYRVTVAPVTGRVTVAETS